MRLLVAVVVLVGAGYGFAAWRLFPGLDDPTEAEFTPVPDLTGAPLEEARAALDALGLAVAERGSLHHAQVARGRVVAQRPLPGQVARDGDTVALSLSAGAEARVVPDLAGFPSADAVRLLGRLGFEYEVEVVDAPAEGALRTEPEAGTRVELPAAVTLFVSRGAGIVTVPDLRGRHVDDLPDLLEEANLVLGSVNYRTGDLPGRVLFQSPAAGAAMRGEGRVSVIVAR